MNYESHAAADAAVVAAAAALLLSRARTHGIGIVGVNGGRRSAAAIKGISLVITYTVVVSKIRRVNKSTAAALLQPDNNSKPLSATAEK